MRKESTCHAESKKTSLQYLLPENMLLAQVSIKCLTASPDVIITLLLEIPWDNIMEQKINALLFFIS